MKRLLSIVAVCLVLGWGLFGPRGLELHQRVLIQAIGIDKTATGYQVTLRAASTSQQAEERLYTCTGATLEQALESFSHATGREPLYSHTGLVVFGKTCAQAGLEEVLAPFYQGRPTVKLSLSSDSAKEILSAKQDSILAPVEEISALVETDLLTFYNDENRPGSQGTLPVLSVYEGQVARSGQAVFQDYRLLGIEKAG